MMKAPLIPGTRPVGAAHSSQSRTHVNQRPEFAATPGGDGPRPQETGAAGCAYKSGAVHVGAKIENACKGSSP
jgi:hypothetical protein